MSEPMKPSSVWICSVFTLFQKWNRTKLISLVRFGLVRLIGLFKNTIKKNSYSHKIFHRSLYNCISYFVISCSLFFKQLFITNLTQYFIHMIQDSFIHHSSKTTSSNSNILIIHDPYMHHSSTNTKIPKKTILKLKHSQNNKSMQIEIKTFWNLNVMKLNKNIQTKSIKFQRESSTDEMRENEWIKKYFV